ncbi:NOC3L [Bugula neritina]|uniref:NOC3L n=1 Tax=Bugula neritina TaxID=10212 RepID=A0A7J7J316_BUGNE|nr:NOC3L [Bugula neritina]
MIKRGRQVLSCLSNYLALLVSQTTLLYLSVKLPCSTCLSNYLALLVSNYLALLVSQTTLLYLSLKLPCSTCQSNYLALLVSQTTLLYLSQTTLLYLSVKLPCSACLSNYLALLVSQTTLLYLSVKLPCSTCQVMNTFLALRIKEINTEEEKQKKLTHKEKMKQWSRKERKLDKKRKELNKQLEEAAVELNRSKILQARTDTITAIFTLYFIILKKAQDSALLSPVLAGLAKFAHLINVDFFDDLFKVFGEILQLEILNIADVLNITRTAFTILSGQGEALNIDPQRFYTQLYKVLPQLATGEGSACIENIPEIFKLMFIDRKKKVTNARVLAYTKRLVSVSIHLEGEPALVVLTVVRNLFSTFPYTDVLLDTECIGSGMYRPDIDEPEYCNAHNSTVLSPDELIDEIQQQNLATSHTAGQKQKRKAVNTEAVKLKQSYSTIE